VIWWVGGVVLLALVTLACVALVEALVWSLDRLAFTVRQWRKTRR
jgi:hypothetical protein